MNEVVTQAVEQAISDSLHFDVRPPPSLPPAFFCCCVKGSYTGWGCQCHPDARLKATSAKGWGGHKAATTFFPPGRCWGWWGLRASACS